MMKKLLFKLMIIFIAGGIFVGLSAGIQADSGQLSKACINTNTNLINNKPVMQSLSPDGRELFGTWQYQSDPKLTRTYYPNRMFFEKLNEDNSNYASGIWKYDPVKRMIVHYYSTMIVDGMDIVNQMKSRTMSFAIKNFAQNMIDGYLIETKTPQKLIKE